VDTSCACQTCGKHFSTANAYDNHLKSKKHRETVAKHDKCSTLNVQQMNAKNEGKTKDATHSSNQLQCDSGVKSMASEMGAVGGVAEIPQQERDSGTICCQLIMIRLIYVIKCLIVIFWIKSLR